MRAAIALSLLLLLLLSALAAAFVWESGRDTKAAAATRASSAAFIAAAHVRWLIEANLQALRRIDDTLGPAPNIAAMSAVADLDAAVASLPGKVSIWVFDADGRSVLSSSAAGRAPISIADRDYFQELRGGQEWRIGPLITGATTGRKLFTIGRRIDREGRFVGAAVIYVPADLMAEFWGSMNLGPGSSVGLLRDDGWLVARHPVPAEALNLSNYVLFTEHLKRAPAGVYDADSPADGTQRLVAYQRVEGMPLVAVVGIATQSVVDRFGERIGAFAMITGPIALALIVVSLLVLRLLRKEEQARTELAEALEQNRLLLREIHHRVKNNLQTVSALVQLQPGAPEAKEDLQRRIAAMTAVHEHIYQSDQFGRIDLAEYIRKLVSGLQQGYGSAVRVHCTLEPVEIGPDQALPLGLIVNEVVSNAFKHAFPEGRQGTIAVTLTAEDGTGLLRVSDDGVGYAADRPSGMGSRLIRGLTGQIGGRSSVRSDGGTVFELEFPIRPDAAPGSARNAA